MDRVNRREFVTAAAAMGATLLWAGRTAAASRVVWREDRTAYPEGVASGDPLPDSVILWTRRPFLEGTQATLTAEVALDPDFRQVVAAKKVPVLAEADWTCRALVAGLKPATLYW
jgi:alkaline phosphatase D